MKKLIPLMILTGAISGFSQGIVQFQNSAVFGTTDPSGGNRLVYNVGSPLNPATGTPLLGTNYVAELFVGPANTSDPNSLTAIPASISRFRATTTVNPGKWATTGISGPNVQVDVGAAIGTVLTLQVRVWDFSTSPTFAGATGPTGQSTLFAFTAADKGGSPNTWLMEGLQAFALVPEPSAIALGVLGVAGLFFVRRRK